MAQILTQRMMATVGGDGLVVFLVGARFNRPWKLKSTLSVALGMTRMMAELRNHPELGFLSAEEYFGRTTLAVQYWKSLRHLLDYAHAKDSAHLPAWRDFNRTVANNADVGIWHETYMIQPGQYENVYHHMPPFGLGRAGKLEPIGKRSRPTETASERLAVSTSAPLEDAP
jgi:hypothetical protein